MGEGNYSAEAGGVEEGEQVPVWATKVESCSGVNITNAKVCEDEIVTLICTDESGEFTLKLTGPNGNEQTLVKKKQRGKGSYTDSFKFNKLPVGKEFNKLEATFETNSETLTDEFSEFKSFLSMGVVRHSQYNQPVESDPSCQGGGAVDICFRDKQCNYSTAQLRHRTFDREAWENGSGISIDHGPIQRESFCHIKEREKFPPPDKCKRKNNKDKHIYENSITTACGGDLDETTVAINEENDFLKCKDKICINPGGEKVDTKIKTVTDFCGKCDKNKQIDNFTSENACEGEVQDLGNFTTLKFLE